MEQGCCATSLEVQVKSENECSECRDFKCSEMKVESLHEEIQFEEILCPLGTYAFTPVLQSKILSRLPDNWTFLVDNSVHFFLVSKDVERTTQRRVSVSFLGEVTISVHRMLLSNYVYHKILRNVKVVTLTEETVDQFAAGALSVVEKVDKYEVCVGCVKEDYRCFWNSHGHGVVDFNPYGELRYSTTFRPNQCQLLVHPSKQRCMECYKISELFRKRLKVRCDGIKSNAPNIHLTEEEKINKIKSLKKELESSKKIISNLKKKKQQLEADDALLN